MDRDATAAQVRMLGDLLGRTIDEIEGPEQLELVERVRQLSSAHHAGDVSASEQLRGVLSSASSHDAAVLASAFASWFLLVNLAEDQALARQLIVDRTAAHEQERPFDETILAAVQHLHDRGVREISGLIAELEIRPVLTAHPTESKRRTVLTKLGRITDALRRLDQETLSPSARERIVDFLAEEITSLWLTDDTRARPPGVIDEVRNGLFWIDATLFDLTPRLYRELHDAVDAVYPGQASTGRFLRFGSWIGGDRDGNPNVTVEVTEQTLREHQRLALRLLRRSIDRMHAHLSVSASRSTTEALAERYEQLCALHPQAALEVEERYDEQPHRCFLALVYRVLLATEQRVDRPWRPDHRPDPTVYASATEFVDDLQLLRDSIRQAGGARIADGRLLDLQIQAEVFGFHLLTLDLRQHSSVHADTLAEIFASYGISDEYRKLAEEERVALLERELDVGRPLTPAVLGFSERANETIELFRLVRRAYDRIGTDAIDTYIVSMTHDVSDVLAVLLFARDAGCDEGLDLVPLFETVDDLDRAGDVLDRLLATQAYRAHVTGRGNRQQVMIGYSDSNKDGGYLTASWQLQQAQRTLAATAARHGVTLTIFHGRGGSIGRGGGPTNAAIRAQPPEAVRGRFKVTEQGEVIAARYRDRALAHRHLEQVVHAVLLTARPERRSTTSPRTDQVLSELAREAERSYRRLVHDTPQLVDFLHEATPLAAIGRLNIASRPARRSSASGVGDLRAIPWVFAWTQCRIHLPAWYGIGTALHTWADGDEQRWRELADLTTSTPSLAVLFDNVEMALAKVDLRIAARYAALARDEVTDHVFPRIVEEFERTVDGLLRVTGHDELLSHDPVLRQVLRLRDPYLEPLHALQVSLLARRRDGTDEAIDHALLVATNGIAAGLRNTG